MTLTDEDDYNFPKPAAAPNMKNMLGGLLNTLAGEGHLGSFRKNINPVVLSK